MSRFYGSVSSSQDGRNQFVWVIDTSISDRTVTAYFKIFSKGAYTPYYSWNHTVKCIVGGNTVLDATGKYPNSDGSWVACSENIGGTTYQRVYTLASGSASVGSGGGSIASSFSYSITGTAKYLPTKGTKTVSGTDNIGPISLWNNINAYQPDGSNEGGLIFNLSTSDGSSWSNLTNEPSDFTKPYGTTATISNIRSNVTGTHYTYNNVTNNGASSFTWTFTTASWACCLYSAWNTYTITYNANGGSGVPGNQTKTYGTNLTLSSTKPTRTGYTFLGWSTNSGATSASYSAGATLSSDLSTTHGATVTLYAIWSINSYYLDLNGWLDGASSGGISGYGTADVTIGGVLKGNDVTDYYVQHPYGTSYVISDIKATTGHTYQGVHSGSLSGTIGVGGTSVYLSFTTNTYTITYNANGGSGAPGNQTKTYGTNLTLSSTKPTRTNYTFLGWSTNKSATSATYSAGATLSSDLSTAQGATVTLYAIWKLDVPSAASHTIKYSTRSKIGINVSGNGAEISNYTVYYRANSIGSYLSLNLGTGTTGTITGLSPNTTYQIFVRVTNAAGYKDSTASTYKTIAYIPNSLSVSVSNTLPFTTDFNVTGNGDTNAGITNRTVYCCTKPNKPIYDMAIKTLPDGSLWARIFYHNVKEGTLLFSSVSEARNVQTEDKYSRLYLLDDDTYKGSDGKFEFMLCYPNDTTQYNRWKQTNNPCSIYTGGGAGTFVPGYEAIHIDWAGESWGGLERNSSDASSILYTYLDGSVGFSNWWYAIAPTEVFEYGMPGPGVTTSSIVEVWVRIGSTNVLTKDLGTSTTGTFTGLAEETEYIIWTGTSNAYGTNYSAATSFTTPADQAKIRIKQDGTWKKGKTYYKKDGQWVKAKKIYIKVDGQWKINNNYDS